VRCVRVSAAAEFSEMKCEFSFGSKVLRLSFRNALGVLVTRTASRWLSPRFSALLGQGAGTAATSLGRQRLAHEHDLEAQERQLLATQLQTVDGQQRGVAVHDLQAPQ
jgi:hypothetical protein